MPDYSDFRTVRIAVNTDKSAAMDPPVPWHAGESLKLVVSGLPASADPDTLLLSLHDTTTPFGALLTPPAAWYAVPEVPGSYYASLDLATDEISDYLADTTPGDAKYARLYLADAEGVWLDVAVPLAPAPYLDQSAWPEPVSPYAQTAAVILKADLLAGITPILAMPTLTAAQREARLQALLNLLETLAT